MKRQTIKIHQDVVEIGKAVESVLQEWFMGKWVVVRAISSNDHSDISKEVLIDTIIEAGTDRYDVDRKGVHHDMDVTYRIDLHATPMHIGHTVTAPHYTGERLSTGTPIGEALLDLQEGGKIDRGFSVVADVILIYDIDQLLPAPMQWDDLGEPVLFEGSIDPTETTVFRFADASQKNRALIGIIEIETEL